MRTLENFIGDESETIDISPLIDMVFILLVFFVVTTSFVEERGLVANTIESSMPNLKTSEPFEVSLLNSGEVIFGERSVSMPVLRSMLEVAATMSNQPVILKIESEVSSASMVTVMDTIAAVGLKDVSLREL